MADQTYLSTEQKHYIEPWNQRVFQYNTDQSDVFLSRVANSVFRVFGDDIVLSGLNTEGVAHDLDSVSVTLTGGDILQDNTLLKIPDQIIELQLAGLSGLDSSGRIVVFSNYGYLETFEKNDQHFRIDYITPGGNSWLGFQELRDRIVLGIFQFTKDGSDNVDGFYISPDTEITIEGKTFYLKGFSPENKRLTAYILHQLFNVVSGYSVVLDPVDGIKLKNDSIEPGPAKYYGTGPTGNKGFFDVSELSFDNESSLPDFMGGYNQVLHNGNLYFIKDGHDISEFLDAEVPVWSSMFDDTFWSPGAGVFWSGGVWDIVPDTSVDLTPINGWEVDFRPVAIRITGQNNQATATLYAPTSVGVVLHGIDEQTSVGAISDMTEDIDHLSLTGYTQITNIEFLAQAISVPVLDLLDDIYWDPNNASWNGTAFVDDGSNSMALRAVPTGWNIGFQPTQITILGTVSGTGSPLVSVIDQMGTPIGDSILATFGEAVIPLDFTDARELTTLSINGFSEITSITVEGGQLGDQSALIWEDAFDNNFWNVVSGGSWDGSKYVATVSNLVLEYNGLGWADGFRPNLIRITGTVIDEGPVHLKDASGNKIISRVWDPVTGETITTTIFTGTFSDDVDIYTLELTGYSEVTNIEFSGGTFGAST